MITHKEPQITYRPFMKTQTSLLQMITVRLFLIALFFGIISTANLYGHNSSELAFSPSEPRVVAEDNSLLYMNPLWSPDGTLIAFTSSGYRGLWTVPSEGGEATTLSELNGVGFGYQWSSDGTSIAGRATRYENHHQWQAIIRIDVENKEEKLLKDYTIERIGVPQWIDFDQKIVVRSGSSLSIIETGKERQAREKRPLDETALLSGNYQIEKVDLANRETLIIRDFEDRLILNPTLSPDGQTIAFQIVGEGLFLMDRDGSNMRDLGRAEQPVWSPDGSFLIAMVTEDDGHHVTGSEIYAIDATSGKRHHLTAHTDLIALYPTLSPDGNHIAFGDYQDGRIYTMAIR